MFDELVTGEEKQSPVDALLKLLDDDNRDSKTVLEMPHIRFLLGVRNKSLMKQYPKMSIIEREELLMEYYKSLKTSYLGMSWEKVVEGIKEMKPQLMQANMEDNPRQ